jgi:hypothetical protein
VEREASIGDLPEMVSARDSQGAPGRVDGKLSALIGMAGCGGVIASVVLP